tara:strand:+ start:16 stop:168 length:153 start_codon:yes stop_codon:yes gene_type:complete
MEEVVEVEKVQAPHDQELMVVLLVVALEMEGLLEELEINKLEQRVPFQDL